MLLESFPFPFSNKANLTVDGHRLANLIYLSSWDIWSCICESPEYKLQWQCLVVTLDTTLHIFV